MLASFQSGRGESLGTRLAIIGTSSHAPWWGRNVVGYMGIGKFAAETKELVSHVSRPLPDFISQLSTAVKQEVAATR